jgi:MFS family permease
VEANGAVTTRPTPPWLFLFLDLPFGAAVGYATIVMPYLLREGGVDLERLAVVSATVFLPHAVKIFWIPVLDLAGTKRGWYLAMSFATAGLLVAASLVPDPVGGVELYALLLAASQATATTAHAANNALMAVTTREAEKGRAGGFSMASNVGGTSLLGALALVVSQSFSARAGGILLAAVVVASALAALRIEEPRPVRREAMAPRRFAQSRFWKVVWGVLVHAWEMLKDLGRTIRSREGFTGLVICLAPVGCQAMSNLFAGIGTDYRAGANLVSLTVGVGGGVAGAAGALVGGVLSDRMSRRVAYAASGGVTALCALAMAAAPMTPATYAWGTFTYLFAGGIAFATWAGMVLEMVGLSAATATKYALFNASANLAISYVTALDGVGGRVLSERFGIAPARGLLVTDAVLTFLGVGVLVAMVILVPPRPGPRARPAEVEPGASA